jgi:hypothetical protein
MEAPSSCAARNSWDRTARGAGGGGGTGTWHDLTCLETSRWGGWWSGGRGTWPGGLTGGDWSATHNKKKGKERKKRRPRESVEVGVSRAGSPPTGRFLAACISLGQSVPLHAVHRYFGTGCYSGAGGGKTASKAQTRRRWIRGERK